MRLSVFAIAATIVLLPGGAVAQVVGTVNADKLRHDNQVQLKPPGRLRSPCAEYGAGFAPIAGTSTCARIGGSIGVEVRTGNGAPRGTR